MQRFKVLLFAAMAVCALSATMVASAYGATEALNAAGQATAVKLTGTNKTTTTLTILEKTLNIKCSENEDEGELEATGKLGKFHITFKGCTTNLGGTCTGLGDETAGTILIGGTVHLVSNVALTGEAALTRAMLLFLVEHAHWTCTVFGVATLILTLGEYLCGISPLVLGTAFEVACKTNGTAGDAQWTEYENEAGVKTVLGNPLKSSEGDTTEVMSGQEGTGKLTSNISVKLDV